MKRKYKAVFASIFCASLVVVVEGCTPVTMATVAATNGLSYMTSGKGITDHALSGALDEDCNLLRILGGREVCIPVDGDGQPDAVMVAEEETGAPEAFLTAAGDETQYRPEDDPVWRYMMARVRGTPDLPSTIDVAATESFALAVD